MRQSFKRVSLDGLFGAQIENAKLVGMIWGRLPVLHCVSVLEMDCSSCHSRNVVLLRYHNPTYLIMLHDLMEELSNCS